MEELVRLVLQVVPAWLAVLIILGFVLVAAAIRVIREYERAVVFRLGRLIGAKGPGLFWLWPIIDRMVKMDLRVLNFEIPKQDMMTRDNVTVAVDAVVFLQVHDASKAVNNVMEFFKSTILFAQAALRSTVGANELDQLLSERDRINQHLQHMIDEQTEPWGVKVTSVGVRDVILPDSMKRAMARQAEAERERRGKITHAEGEREAAEELVKAANMIAANPIALQLRFLQTLTAVASEHNSTTILPVPIDLFTPFLRAAAAAVPTQPPAPQSGTEKSSQQSG
jgi:regulator of protease activity HflC (stomatin/prohibitin superfamily)